MYHSCFHLSAFRFYLQQLNFGLTILHIVAEPATDYCRYVGVEDTMEKLLMVHIVEFSCQIERDEHCTVSRLFFLRSRRSSSTVQYMSSVLAESHVEQGGKG